MNVLRLVFFCAATVSMSDVTNAGGLLYPHLPNNGDLPGPTEDDKATVLSVDGVIRFMGSRNRKLYVNENGVVSFKEEFPEYIPFNMPFQPDPIISVFWADHDVEATGGSWKNQIFYRGTSDAEILARAKVDIEKYFRTVPEGDEELCNNLKDGSFDPEYVVIVTYSEVRPFCVDHVDAEDDNTYQLVIIRGRNAETYVMFNFHHIEWVEGCPDEGTRVGFNKGDGSIDFELPYSGTPDVYKLAEESNVGKPGRWVYRVNNPDYIMKPPICEQA